AAYGVTGPIGTVSAVDVSEAIPAVLGCSVTGIILVPSTVVPSSSCTSKVAAPCASVPTPPFAFDGTIEQGIVKVPLGSTPAPAPHMTAAPPAARRAAP